MRHVLTSAHSSAQRSTSARSLIPQALLILALPLLLSLPVSAATVEVNVSSNMFNPAQVVIQIGDTVTWTNVQGTHNVAADDASFRSGDPAPAPWSFSVTFTEPGAYPYHCELHGGPGGEGMSGLVVVENETNQGSVAFTSSSYTVLEGAVEALVTLRRTGGSEGAVSVDYSTADGSAEAGADYEQTSGSITWLDGESGDKSFMVAIFDDSSAEGTESVQLLLDNPIGGVEIGEPDTAGLLIVDDDGDGTPCNPSATVLCLNEGRFRVSTTWRRPDGATGVGRAVPLTEDTGYFWFFNADNVEVIVKVLNGCPVNDRYWVFAGGLTNVEVTLTVEDTATDTVQPYQNPLRRPFQPIQDTGAFATCP